MALQVIFLPSVSSWLTLEGRRLLKLGYIMMYCKTCKTETWHRPNQIRKYTKASRFSGYYDRYQCTQCGNILKWHYRPSWS